MQKGLDIVCLVDPYVDVCFVIRLLGQNVTKLLLLLLL
jgi:hypothetical protein